MWHRSSENGRPVYYREGVEVIRADGYWYVREADTHKTLTGDDTLGGAQALADGIIGERAS